MAKFGINDLIDIRKKGSQTGAVNEYQEIWLSPYDVKPSESNFYSQEKIEELADSFLTVGQQQPTVLARVEGEFRIVSGHRRNLANIRNLERGHEEYRKVRYLYKDMTPSMLELSLVMGNALNRELTAWERTRQAQRLKETLLKARDEDGLEIRGKLRDVIADLMNESSSNIARMESISSHAAAEIREEFEKGNIGISAAYEASKLPPDVQKELAGKIAEGNHMQVKKIRGKTAEDDKRSGTGPAVGRAAVDRPIRRGVSGASEACDRKEPEGRKGEESGKRVEKRRDKHREILREWGRQNGRNITVSKAVSDAIQRVSEPDIGKEGWEDTEWAVYLTKTIMDLADHVSEGDLYLLHDIVIRCQEG